MKAYRVPLASHAESGFTVRSVDSPTRVLEGWASTPQPDRFGDIIEPLGMVREGFTPLLWQHQHDQPVGEVLSATPSRDGVKITARIARIAEVGKLKEATDLAWQSVAAGVVRTLSIGFKPIEHEPIRGGKGLRFTKWNLYEVSLVSVAANPGCTITTTRGASEMVEAQYSPAVAEIMRRFEAEQEASEAARLDQLRQEREQAAERHAQRGGPVDLEKHMTKRLRHEVGRSAFPVVPTPRRFRV